jgi:hypothetical protein
MHASRSRQNLGVVRLPQGTRLVQQQIVDARREPVARSAGEAKSGFERVTSVLECATSAVSMVKDRGARQSHGWREVTRLGRMLFTYRLTFRPCPRNSVN